MKLILLIGLLVGPFLLQNSGSNEMIGWASTYKLKWSDFRGKPTQQNYGASTSCSINTKHVISTDSIRIQVNAVMFPESSWYKAKDTTISMLAHEQLHFDLVELNARRLRKVYLTYSFSVQRSHVNAEIIDLDRVQYNKLIDEHNKYDKETKHGTDIKIQFKWVKKVDSALKSLQQYAGSEIVIKRKNK